MFFKKKIPFLLMILVAFVNSLNPEDYVTIKKKTECDCDDVNDFVCATNNVTYRNECLLKKCVAHYNPDIQFLHKGRCKSDIKDAEGTVKSENKRQKRALNRPKQVHGLHQRKSLVPKYLKNKAARVNFPAQNNARSFIGKLRRPNGKLNRNI